MDFLGRGPQLFVGQFLAFRPERQCIPLMQYLGPSLGVTNRDRGQPPSSSAFSFRRALAAAALFATIALQSFEGLASKAEIEDG